MREAVEGLKAAGDQLAAGARDEVTAPAAGEGYERRATDAEDQQHLGVRGGAGARGGHGTRVALGQRGGRGATPTVAGSTSATRMPSRRIARLPALHVATDSTRPGAQPDDLLEVRSVRVRQLKARHAAQRRQEGAVAARRSADRQRPHSQLCQRVGAEGAERDDALRCRGARCLCAGGHEHAGRREPAAGPQSELGFQY
jgi:hypothetical protein